MLKLKIRGNSKLKLQNDANHEQDQPFPCRLLTVDRGRACGWVDPRVEFYPSKSQRLVICRVDACPPRDQGLTGAQLFTGQKIWSSSRRRKYKHIIVMATENRFSCFTVLLCSAAVCGLFQQTKAADPGAAGQPNSTVKALKVVTLLDPPFVMMSALGLSYEGFAVDVLNEAVKKIGYDSVSIQTHEDARFGMEESPGKWNGLIGAVQNQSADLALAAFSPTSKRSEAVEFSQPFMVAGFRVLAKIPDSWHPGRAMVTMVKPFSAGLWVLIILMFVVASVALYAIGRFSPFEDVAFVGKSATFEGLTLSNSFLYVFSTLLFQGYTAVPKSMSGRVLTGVWWVFVLFTVAAYIAGLTVILFRVNPEIRTLPFTTLNELSRQSQVGLLVIGNSTAHKYLKSSHNKLESRLLAVVTANQDHLIVPNFAEGMKKVMEEDNKFVMLMDGSMAQYLSTKEPCDKMVVGEKIGDYSFAFACRKDSGVCARISTEILAMKEDRRMSAFEKKWFHEGCLKDKPKNYMFEGVPFFDTFLGDPDVIMPMTITVTRFSAAFIMFTVGLLIAGLVLAGEIWWARKRGIAVPRKLERDGRDDDIQRIDNDFHDDPGAFHT
ncbi:hypothetical protein RRG08_049738 [Elysia crispata]|uniref:Uncharacterized protein n=1 Tax=Elysia crispata TaxID=231223 RepID=A0AAE1CYX2_9GAST|nr:hypothetical protein RRG08_049738 [Elysia crispata]